MKNSLWSKFDSEVDLGELESYLQEVLEPVEPRPGYVRDLRNRLSNSGGKPGYSLDLLQYILFGVAGIITSFLIVITGVRATRSLITAWNQSSQEKKNIQQQAAAPLNPAA